MEKYSSWFSLHETAPLHLDITPETAGCFHKQPTHSPISPNVCAEDDECDSESKIKYSLA